MGRHTKQMSREREDQNAPALKVGDSYDGVFQSARERGGFVVLESPGLGDVFVAAEASGAALHGDQVRVVVLRHRADRAPEGRIERVLRHANRKIVGQLRRTGKILLVAPKNRKIRRLIEIHRRFSNEEVPNGAWVVVEIQSWSEFPNVPLTGKLVEVLGTEKDERLPILLLIREDGVYEEFPSEVEDEAQEILKRRISPHELDRRRDFRSDRVVTIDPATAKDFDDAVSLVARRHEGWRVAVHIADVAHYVHAGSKIEAEAYERATSIYPVDRVIPMLPEALSNDLCSLRPDEDRLTMSAVFDVDRRGNVSGVELSESVIHSARRFTYEEVQGLFDDADGIQHSPYPIPAVPENLREDLLEFRKIAAALLAARLQRGALDLELPETEILFDAEGIVAGVRRKTRFESHRLIEDLMLSANEAVARELAQNAVPFLYRVHEAPAESKLRTLAPALARFGVVLPHKGSMTQEQLQAAIIKAKEHPAGEIVQRLILRSMMRAHYQPGNVGHFGLASACYCHFTSPIRRYPDLLVHRAVKSLLGRGKDGEQSEAAESLTEWGRHASSREERSQRIERDAQKIISCEFMRRFLGDIFEGFISGLINRGFFVELLDHPVEGFVPIRTLEDDYYDLDEAGMAFYGRRSGRAYALGDQVKVQIERIDVLAGEMDLILVRKEAVRKKRGMRRRRD